LFVAINRAEPLPADKREAIKMKLASDMEGAKAVFQWRKDRYAMLSSEEVIDAVTQKPSVTDTTTSQGEKQKKLDFTEEMLDMVCSVPQLRAILEPSIEVKEGSSMTLEQAKALCSSCFRPGSEDEPIVRGVRATGEPGVKAFFTFFIGTKSDFEFMKEKGYFGELGTPTTFMIRDDIEFPPCLSFPWGAKVLPTGTG
jgi:hypothetical protein